MKLVIVTGMFGGLFGAARYVTVTSWLELLVLIGAAVAAAGVLHVRVVRPAVRFTRRVALGVDILFELHDWRREVAKWRREIDRRLDDIEARV